MTFRSRLAHPQSGGLYFLTWRLSDSLPVAAVADLISGDGPKFLLANRVLDAAATGPRWLLRRDVAGAVAEVLTAGAHSGRYELGAWVLMPNHIHCVIRPAGNLGPVVSWIKATSARHSNRLLKRVGLPFWSRDYFDRVIRDRKELERVVRYIANNPVKAGLCGTAED